MLEVIEEENVIEEIIFPQDGLNKKGNRIFENKQEENKQARKSSVRGGRPVWFRRTPMLEVIEEENVIEEIIFPQDGLNKKGNRIFENKQEENKQARKSS